MTKHTPGPWDAGASLVSHKGREIALVREPRLYRDGRPWIRNSAAETMAEYEANVLLIAAAPDMLDVLLKADAWVAQYHDMPGHDAASRCMSALLRKVIARAEGL